MTLTEKTPFRSNLTPDVVKADKLQLALIFAQSLLIDVEQQNSVSLQTLDDIELPDISASTRDLTVLKPLAPLYLAFEMEQVGLLLMADKIAGLYASGAIKQSLGGVEKDILAFWSKRHERLSQQERMSILEQSFESRVFYPQFLRLCQALLALADNNTDQRSGEDIQEEISVDILLQQLREYFFSRPLGMISYASQDILSAISMALTFMKQALLQSAFGVNSLWDLLSISSENTNYANRQHAEMASAGMILLNWLAIPESGQIELMNVEKKQHLISASQRWLLAYSALNIDSNTTNSNTALQITNHSRSR